jgi:GTP diphosphokinase / guanosine-3',5'-bis(diphosphate) 3'-diphosphatase
MFCPFNFNLNNSKGERSVAKTVEIQEIRPTLANEFEPGPFIARTEAIAEAYRWGQELHAGQKRLSGEPYFETHCGWVAMFLDRLVGNEAWTIAGLLHDSVEDSGESIERIRQKFPGALGEEVAYIVDGVTKLSNPRDGRSREMETLRKMAMFRDPGVFVVKLADKSHNLMTLEHMKEPKRTQKATEAIRAYGKLAGIMNCYKWRRWIEDMAFPFAEPETYAFVRPKIDNDPRLQAAFINPILQQLAQLMERAGIDGQVSIIVNGYWRAWQKLRALARARKSSLNSFAAVSDMVSFRMVVHENDEMQCYRLLAEVNRFFGSFIDQTQFNDYIAYPQNRYRSLHTAVWMQGLGMIEIAIATEEMEGENMWGVVYALSHGKDISSYRPVEILTPSGSARFVPEGSTVLDAVASIQQEFLLDKISAVQVNGVLARLSDQVKPGDVVEVITSGSRIAPSEDWLNYSNSSTVRLLQAVLATESLRRAAEQGRDMIKTVLVQHGLLALEDVRALERDRWDNLLERLACANLDDLYAAVGGGAVRVEDLDRALTETGINREDLGWTTISFIGTGKSHRPGVLAHLAGMVSQHGGNILRSVNNTLPEGGFDLRLVVSNLNTATVESLARDYHRAGIEFTSLEVV